jgi:recombination protein RecT
MADIAELKGQQSKAVANTFPEMLNTYKGEIARALPKHLNADRLARIALTSFRQTPALGKCDPRSVFASVIQASQLGLEPGLLGQAYLVPYGNQCQLIPGYQGLIDLALRSGRVVSLQAHAVHDKDTFEYELGATPMLKHKPSMADDRGPIIAFYAVAKLSNGEPVFEVMSRSDVDKVMHKSQSKGNSGPWKDHYEQMGRKTAIRRLFKFLPKSVEMAQAMTLDAVASEGKAQNITVGDAIDGTWVPVEDDTPAADKPVTME